ncbi:MAG TPA: hypothetical protein VLJ39_18415 [Tepidisphaeraceae bacterium]|jgi:hypothetical protein|nr:hypothetical protein [Tepidisphaeraceae bacterium]
MNAQELRSIAYQLPFRPFRVHLKSGESFEIRRSLRTTVAEDRVLFGINEDPETGIARRLRIVALSDVSNVELLSPA